jgi:hypothetical protein
MKPQGRPRKESNPEGRPPKDIDWDEFEFLASIQATQKELCAWFECSLTALDYACQKNKGVSLSEFWQTRRIIGRVKQRKRLEAFAENSDRVAIYVDKKYFPEENPDRKITAEELAKAAQDEAKNLTPGALTFEQFCARAHYFKPFPKQEEMRAFGMDRDDTRLLLGARGYGKTDFVTIMGTAYDLYVAWKTGKDMSEHTNLIITKSGKRAKAIIQEIGNALEANLVPLEQFNSDIIRVVGLVGQDHSVEAITIKTSMRGRHPKRIIMDDPVTDEDVSEAMRLTVKRRYDEAYKLQKNIVIIGQPAHALDLYQTLRGIIATMEVPHGSIPELDVDLEAMKIAGVDAHSIEMSYHLRIPKDGAIPFGALNFINEYPVGDSVAFIDPSEGGDFTAVTVLKMVGQGIVFEGYAWQRAWFLCVDDIKDIFVRLGVRKFCFETNKTGEFPILQLRQVFGPLGIGVIGHASTTNKESTIMVAASMSHMLHLSKNSSPAYTNQVVGYTAKAKYDDAPDSLARCLEWLNLIRGK